MQNKIFQFILLIFIGLQFSGCFGYAVNISTYPAKANTIKKSYPALGWEDLIIYDKLDPNDHYEVLARIVVTGNASASEEKLLKKMRREAGFYGADAILLKESREVERKIFDGFSATFNIISIFDNDDETEPDLDTGGPYISIELEGVAIDFLDE